MQIKVCWGEMERFQDELTKLQSLKMTEPMKTVKKSVNNPPSNSNKEAKENKRKMLIQGVFFK